MNIRRIFVLVLMVLLLTSTCLQPVHANEINIRYTAQPIHISDLGVLPSQNIASYSSSIIGKNTQTKPAYLTIAGDYVGTVTLHYETEMRSGRPQFIYETCNFTWDLRGLPDAYALQMPNVEYTNDYIKITFTVSAGLLNDTITLGYYAYGTPD